MINTGQASDPPRHDLYRYARLGLWALPVWGVLLLIATWTHQPDPDTSFASYAEYITTTRFLFSHLIASIFGAAIGLLGLVALFIVLSQSRAIRLALLGLIAAIVGNVLVTAVFGVAAFAQPAIGNAYRDGLTNEAIAFDNDVYGTALFATALPGLLLFALGLVMFGMAVARSGFMPRWAGHLLALSGILFAIIGFAIGVIQTIGAALLIVSTIWIAIAYASRTSTRPVAQFVAAQEPADPQLVTGDAAKQ